MLFQWFAYDFFLPVPLVTGILSCGSAKWCESSPLFKTLKGTRLLSAFINRGTGREISVVTFRDLSKNWGLPVFPNQSPSSFQFPICKLCKPSQLLMFSSCFHMWPWFENRRSAPLRSTLSHGKIGPLCGPDGRWMQMRFFNNSAYL